MELPDVAELISAFAVDAINIQLKFNQYAEAEVLRTGQLLAGTGHLTVMQEFLRPLTPQALRLDTFDLSLQAAFSVTQEREFDIRVLPLNAEFSIRTSARTDRQNRIQISVQQVFTSKEQLNG